MPIYAYKCRACEHQFEARQRFSDNPLSECPVCNGSIRRVISPVGIVFKGSGFYVTDNRNGKSNGAVTGGNKKQEDSSTTSDSEVDKKKADKSDTSTVAAPQKSSTSESAQSKSTA